MLDMFCSYYQNRLSKTLNTSLAFFTYIFPVKTQLSPVRSHVVTASYLPLVSLDITDIICVNVTVVSHTKHTESQKPIDDLRI